MKSCAAVSRSSSRRSLPSPRRLSPVVIIDAAGKIAGAASLIPGATVTVTAHLHPGTYRLCCSPFAGTPESHYARGMHATLAVR